MPISNHLIWNGFRTCLGHYCSQKPYDYCFPELVPYPFFGNYSLDFCKSDKNLWDGGLSLASMHGIMVLLLASGACRGWDMWAWIENQSRNKTWKKQPVRICSLFPHHIYQKLFLFAFFLCICGSRFSGFLGYTVSWS